MVGHKDWPIVTLKSNPNQNKRATKWTQKNYRGPRPLPWSRTHSPSMRTLVHSTPFPHFPSGAHVSPFIKWWIGAHCAVFQTRKKIVWPVYTRHVSLQKKKEKEKEKEKEKKKKKEKEKKGKLKYYFLVLIFILTLKSSLQVWIIFVSILYASKFLIWTVFMLYLVFFFFFFFCLSSNISKFSFW